jgi:glycosyltransferase involved in cell wall biosynthesis
MKLGLLPALGGSLTELRRSGQTSRLIDGYLRPYVEAFDSVAYFSYVLERFQDFTGDQWLLERVRVFGPQRPQPRAIRAIAMPGAHASDLRACDVLRVYQITGVIPALIVKARFGVPYVTTYGFWYGQLSRPGAKRVMKAIVERLGLRHAAAVIVTTDELRARAVRSARRVELIPNGVDTRLFAPMPGARRAGKPRLLYVGRLSAEKNLFAVLTATAYLATGATFVAAGTGPLREALEARATELGVPVDFRGVVEQTKLPAVYAEADVFVLASFTEGHPKVLLEAMACGLPCVVSDCAGNRSLVTHGVTGLLFDPRDPRQLADCLRQVLDNRDLGRRLGQAARAMVAALYDLGATVEREIALLRDVAQGGI